MFKESEFFPKFSEERKSPNEIFYNRTDLDSVNIMESDLIDTLKEVSGEQDDPE